MKRTLPLLTLALSLLAGCDDGTNTGPSTPPVSTTGPLYAITTQILTTDEGQSYVFVTDKLEDAANLSLDNAIEIPGRALGVGIPKSGALFVGSSEGATVTRYELTADGQLQKGASVSFAGKGVKSIGEYQNQFQFVSATKAYYFDGYTAQAIVWNPTDMSVTGVIPLPGLTVDGSVMTFSTFPVRRENQIIMLAAWRPADTVGITKQAGVIVIDTQKDTATIVKDTRCGYVRDGALAADGQLYLATESYGAAVYRVASDKTPAPCLLRFNPQTLAFDPSFYVELKTLAGGNTGGSLVPGPNGTAYLRVLDETIYPVSATTNPRALASASAWKWWQVQLGTTPTAAPVASLPATTGSTFLFEAEDQTLFTRFTSGAASTDLFLLSGQSGQTKASLQGATFSFLQVR